MASWQASGQSDSETFGRATVRPVECLCVYFVDAVLFCTLLLTHTRLGWMCGVCCQQLISDSLLLTLLSLICWLFNICLLLCFLCCFYLIYCKCTQEAHLKIVWKDTLPFYFPSFYISFIMCVHIYTYVCCWQFSVFIKLRQCFLFKENAM